MAASVLIDAIEKAVLHHGMALNGLSNGHLHSLRTKALEQLQRDGIPTVRHEEWKYTNLLPVTSALTGVASATTDLPEVDSVGTDVVATAWRLVFVDGFFDESRSTLPRDVFVAPLTDELAATDLDVQRLVGSIVSDLSHPTVAMNTACGVQGAVVRIPDGFVNDVPFQVLFMSSIGASTRVTSPRLVVQAGERSQVTFVETSHGGGAQPSTNVCVVEVEAKAGAAVTYLRIVDGKELSQLHYLAANVHRDATVAVTTVSLDARFIRNDVVLRLLEPGATGKLFGATILDEQQLVDNHTVVDHIAPHCHSEELYKGVYDGRSVGVFNGKIFVRPDAQKTLAYQSNRTLLLSPGAQINAKPQLEIWADDVKCSHGATTGSLDPEALFYLQSRGIPADEARRLLTFAFVADVLGRIDIDEVREYCERRLTERLTV